MPTYEYVCEKCGRSFDQFQSMKDPRLTECIFEGCHGPVRRKIGTGAGIIFKGSGFYETDYRSESYREAAKKDQGASSEGGKSESGPGSKGAETAGGKTADAKPASGSKDAGSSPAKSTPAAPSKKEKKTD